MTSVLVAFATRGGTTQSIAERLGSVLTTLGHAVSVVPVEDDPDPGAYRAVVIGSGILSGHIYRPAQVWLERHARPLAARPPAAFVVCLPAAAPGKGPTPEAYADQLTAPLHVEPLSRAVFAGAYDPHTRPWQDRLLMRARGQRPADLRDWAAIDAWAEELATLL